MTASSPSVSERQPARGEARKFGGNVRARAARTLLILSSFGANPNEYASSEKESDVQTDVLLRGICRGAGVEQPLGARQQPGTSDRIIHFPRWAGGLHHRHTIEHYTGYGRYPIPPTNIVDRHLPGEQRVKKEFEERRAYKVVSRAGEADFVFLVVIHHNAAEAMALSPEKYQLYRSKFDLEALREAAYYRWTVGPFKIHNLGRLSDRLVKKFHEAAQVSTKTN